jgi:hypothetical protein
MNPQHYLSVDERLLGVCAYCGGPPDTRDHVPCKFLLDDPLPDQLPVVDACTKCNQGASLDEEYFGCFLECVIVGSTDPGVLLREKVKRALSRNGRLAERIRASAHANADGALLWTPEDDRVRNVVAKLARGHAAYELSITQIDDPDDVHYFPLVSLSSEDRAVFESAQSGQLRPWPEIGSRAFLRACGAELFSDQRGPWVLVRPGQYRYSVDQHGGVRVQIVVGEYLGCIVEWH